MNFATIKDKIQNLSVLLFPHVDTAVWVSDISGLYFDGSYYYIPGT